MDDTIHAPQHDHLKALIDAEKQTRQKMHQAKEDAENMKQEAMEWARNRKETAMRESIELKERLLDQVDEENTIHKEAMSTEVAATIQAMETAYKRRKEKLIDAFQRYVIRKCDRRQLEAELESHEVNNR